MKGARVGWLPFAASKRTNMNQQIEEAEANRKGRVIYLGSFFFLPGSPGSLCIAEERTTSKQSNVERCGEFAAAHGSVGATTTV